MHKANISKKTSFRQALTPLFELFIFALVDELLLFTWLVWRVFTLVDVEMYNWVCVWVVDTLVVFVVVNANVDVEDEVDVGTLPLQSFVVQQYVVYINTPLFWVPLVQVAVHDSV